MSNQDLTIEDELACSAKRVGNLDEVRAGLCGECLGGSPAATRKEQVVLGTSSTDGVDDSLDRVGPGGNGWDIMWLVHDTKNDPLLAAVFLSELRPQTGELGVSWTTLSNDTAVPARVVVL